MFQIDNDTSSQNLPAPTAAGQPGYFVDGDPAKGLAATILPAEFMNMLMMEFINLLKAAGLTPNKSDYTQLSQALPLLIARLATVDWSKVTNIPADLVHLNTSPSFASIELYNTNPFIDFHFNNDPADLNVRIVNNVDGGLAIANKSTTMLTLGPSLISSNLQHFMTKGAVLYSQGIGASLLFENTNGSKLDYCIQHDDTTFNLICYPDGSPPIAALYLIRSSGNMFFSNRPFFAGNVPWDSGNFNPATKANVATTLAGYGITDAVPVGTYNAGINSLTGSINATNANVSATNASLATTNANLAATNTNLNQTNANVTAANAAIATKQPNLGFTPVRQGGGVGQLTNNIFIGYDGAGIRITVDYIDFGRFLTDSNYSAYFPSGMASVGLYGIGSYGLFCYGPGTAIGPGALVLGSTLHASPTSGYVGNASPPGTWVCCGSTLGNGVTNSTTVFQRIT